MKNIRNFSIIAHIGNTKDYPLQRPVDNYEFNRALDFIWQEISGADGLIEKNKPYLTVTTNPAKARSDIEQLVKALWQIAGWLGSFLPVTADKIKNLMAVGRAPAASLFPRK